MADATLQHGKMVVYKDIGAKFLDERGYFLKDAFRPDNLHPLAKGYDIWGAAVCLQLQPGVDAVLADSVRERKHHQFDHHDGVPAVEFADHGDGSVRSPAARQGLDAELAAGHHGFRDSIHRVARDGVEQTD